MNIYNIGNTRMNADKDQNTVSIVESYPEFKTMMSQFTPAELAEIVKGLKESGTFTEEELNLLCGSARIASQFIKIK